MVSEVRTSLTYLDLGTSLNWSPKTGREVILNQLGIDEPKVIPVSLKKQGLMARIQKTYAVVKGYYERNVPKCLRVRVRWIQKLVAKGIRLIQLIVKVVVPLFDTLRNTSEAVSKEGSKFLLTMRKLKILSAFSLIGIAQSTATNIIGIKESILKKNASDGTNNGLLFVENLSDLFGFGYTVIDGLLELKVLAASQALNIASTSLTGISVILSFGTIIYNAKQWYESSQFRNRLEKKIKGLSSGKTDFKEVVDYIDRQDNRTLQSRLGINSGSKLKARLNLLYIRSKEGTQESKERCIKAAKAMKNRLIVKDLAYALRITACVVSIVASAVLLFTPFAPIGFALLALSTAICIADMVADHVLAYQFEKWMDHLVPISKDMPEDSKGFNEYMKEFEFAGKLRNEAWNQKGKKEFRKEASDILLWKPKASKAKKKPPLDPVNLDSYLYNQLGEGGKPTKEQLHEIEEKKGGMTFDKIRLWKPEKSFS